MTRLEDPVRVGLVGAGFMAKLHSFAFRTAAMRFPGTCRPVELRRVADVDERQARAAVEAFGWREASCDPHAVTRADDIDLVVVATPVFAHAEVSIDALEHRKHVVCEKPLARDAASAAEAHRAATAAGRLHCTAFAMRHWPAVRLAERMLAAGEIGTLVKLRTHYLLDWALGHDVPLGWRFHRAQAGSGSLGDVGSHVIDVMRHLAGDVESVYASLRTIRATRPAGHGEGAVDVDDSADLLLEFASGAGGVLETSWMAPGHKTDIAFELLGDAGALRFAWARNHEIEVCSSDSPGFEIRSVADDDDDLREFAPAPGTPLGLSELFVLQARTILQALAEDRGMAPDFLDGRRVCEVIDAALETSERGCRVPVIREGA
jgi:predicted dehydrogenase